MLTYTRSHRLLEKPYGRALFGPEELGGEDKTLVILPISRVLRQHEQLESSERLRRVCHTLEGDNSHVVPLA